MAIDLATILEPGLLKKIWRDMRRKETQVHLTQIPLLRDATGGSAFELNLDELLSNLKHRILDGTYRPHSPIIIEIAKSKLLHRRLSFLTFEDGLILGTLVQATRASLTNKMAAWVNFGRLEQNDKNVDKHKKVTVDYEGWWTKWLRYRGLLKVIEDDPNPLLPQHREQLHP